MVRLNTILKVIDNYVIKCPTIAEMKQELSSMSYDEQHRELNKQDLFFNVDEAIEYRDLKMGHESLLNRIDRLFNEDPTPYSLIREYQEELYGIEEELFFYGRRLIEGVKPTNPVPQVDKSVFSEDEQYVNRSSEEKNVYKDLGEKEKLQIEAQTKIFRKKSDNRIESPIDEGEYRTLFEDEYDKRYTMNDYFAGDTQKLNLSIYSEKYLNKLTDERKKSIKDIDCLMNKSPGLIEDMVLYRGGKLDIHLREGDHSKFKGYTSTTFQKYTADEYTSSGDMLIKVYAPKGTKGIVGNDDWNFRNGFMEHEYVLPRNQGFTVLSIDYDKGIAEIILDE